VWCLLAKRRDLEPKASFEIGQELNRSEMKTPFWAQRISRETWNYSEILIPKIDSEITIQFVVQSWTIERIKLDERQLLRKDRTREIND
jgi:hypothetical protein